MRFRQYNDPAPLAGLLVCGNFDHVSFFSARGVLQLADPLITGILRFQRMIGRPWYKFSGAANLNKAKVWELHYFSLRRYYPCYDCQIGCNFFHRAHDPIRRIHGSRSTFCHQCRCLRANPRVIWSCHRAPSAWTTRGKQKSCRPNWNHAGPAGSKLGARSMPHEHDQVGWTWSMPPEHDQVQRAWPKNCIS